MIRCTRLPKFSLMIIAFFLIPTATRGWDSPSFSLPRTRCHLHRNPPLPGNPPAEVGFYTCIFPSLLDHFTCVFITQKMENWTHYYLHIWPTIHTPPRLLRFGARRPGPLFRRLAAQHRASASPPYSGSMPSPLPRPVMALHSVFSSSCDSPTPIVTRPPRSRAGGEQDPKAALSELSAGRGEQKRRRWSFVWGRGGEARCDGLGGGRVKDYYLHIWTTIHMKYIWSFVKIVGYSQEYRVIKMPHARNT
jgi:hypothetical protein